MPGGGSRQTLLYTLGSDTVILPRLMKADNLGVVSALQSELHTYSVDGLRTLCLAKRELDDASLSAWYKRYKEATLSLENREDKIEALAEELEEQFEWQGITGVEDKLQDGVSQTLKDFSAAGINAWMLTGDKMETAINIGIATSLLQPNTLQITYNAEEIMRHHEQNPESHIGDNLETETGQHRCLENECNRDLERQGEDCVESQPDFSLSESNGLPHDKGSLQGDLRRVTSSSDVPHSVTANLKTQKVFKNEISNDIQWQGTNSLSDVKDYTPYERHKGRTPSSILEMIVKERMTNDFAFLRKKQDVIISQQKRIQKQSFHKRHHSFSINEKIYESSESELLPVAVVIDGTCLAEALKPSISQIFFNLCSFCSTVICCRATPLQKAAVVSLVKKSQSGVTLAVGDGANDCNMIQQAHVGVGIRGAEGLQAFHVSDYGISQFKFLRILLLCHGRWNYWRISHLVLYMFYKNLVVVIPIFLAGFLSQFSAQKIYYELAYQLFNVFLTSVPVIIVGIFDQDLDKDTSLKFPQLYRLGHGHYFFNRRRFFQWLLQSVVHAAICFTIPVLVFSNAHITSSNGNSMGLFFIGQTIFGCVMIVINLKVILEVPLLTRLIWFAVIFSIFAWVLTMILFSSWPGLAPDLLGMLYDMLTTPLFYFTVVITCTMALSTDFVLKVIKRNFFPEVRDIVVEQPRFISGSAAYERSNRNRTMIKWGTSILNPPSLRLSNIPLFNVLIQTPCPSSCNTRARDSIICTCLVSSTHLSKRSFHDRAKGVTRRHRHVHPGLTAPRSKGFKIDNTNEKVAFVTLGTVKTLAWDRLDPADSATMMARKKYSEKVFERSRGVAPNFVLKLFPSRLENAIIRHEELLCVPFVVGPRNHILETFLLDELVQLEGRIPAILKVLEGLQKKGLVERAKLKHSLPKPLFGSSKDVCELVEIGLFQKTISSTLGPETKSDDVLTIATCFTYGTPS